MSWTAQKIPKKKKKNGGGGGGVEVLGGQKIKSQNKKVKPRWGVGWGGGFRGQNFMNCRENRYFFWEGPERSWVTS